MVSAACLLLAFVFFIPLYLKNKVTTVPGFLADRFGPACGTIYSCILLFLYVFGYMVTVLYAGSLAFSQVTGWNFYVVVALIAVGVGAYTIHGGLTSVMWADLFQCLLLMVGGIMLFFCCAGPCSRRLGRDGAADPQTHAALPAAGAPHGAFSGNHHRDLRGLHLLPGRQPVDDPADALGAEHLGRPDGPGAGLVHQFLSARW